MSKPWRFESTTSARPRREEAAKPGIRRKPQKGPQIEMYMFSIHHLMFGVQHFDIHLNQNSMLTYLNGEKLRVLA